MIFIPGILISWLTFPGVIIHEFAHKQTCDWRDIAVHDVSYFSASGGGHVTHRRPSQFRDTLAISAAPFIVNTVLAFALYVLAYMILLGTATIPGVNSEAGVYIALAIGWVGLSVGWHALPSRTDSKNIWRGARSRWRSSNLALFALPLAALFYVGNLLAIFWFDAIYSIGIALLAITAVRMITTHGLM